MEKIRGIDKWGIIFKHTKKQLKTNFTWINLRNMMLE